MKPLSHRLPAEARHGWGGGALDRTRPLSFRLNGRRLDAFAGDSVLSALLAAGITGMGSFHGEAIGLGERFAPLVAPAQLAHDPVCAMPMDRTPVLAGLDLVTLGPRRRLPFGGLFARFADRVTPRRTMLEHRLDEPQALQAEWREQAAGATLAADMIVVGAGLTGMSAALAAAAQGQQVLLVERRLHPGGDARYFGTVGDEAAPEALIEQLVARIAATPAITLLAGTAALGLVGASLVAHQVRVHENRLEARVLRLTAARIVLATGTAERLPLFAGNRLPGVVGSVAAFQQAERHGVWLGRRAVFAMSHSVGYRLALLAADAGIEVQRAADCRINPQSRFVDFSKASGITLAGGQLVRAAEPGRAAGLAVHFAVSMDESARDAGSVATDLLVVAGGWQPRLGLWLMAGGAAEWDPVQHWLGPRGQLEGVALAGAVAGYRRSDACRASGEAAVAALLGKPAPPVEDMPVDSLYESPDAPTFMAPWRAGRAGFLDRGASLTRRPAPRSAPDAAGTLDNLTLGDVAAAVELGAIPAADAGIVAAERCSGGSLPVGGWTPPATPAPLSPPFLAGRFGPRPQLVAIAAADGRNFEPGALLYGSSEATDPTAAIGVVVGPAPEGRPENLVMAHRAALAAAAVLFVRDSSGAVPVRRTEKQEG